ncbi:adenosine receptor A3-like [Clytia hemisphaerica]|uniref:adenosine receptor A3-like n=1 Tax=Clytia hemisphaerica TaxID=252671 RepID=UPI0034D4E2B2
MVSNNTTTVKQYNPDEITLFYQAYIAIWVIVGLTAFVLNILQIIFIVKKSLNQRNTRVGNSVIFLTSLCMSDGLVGFVMVILIVVIFLLPERHKSTSIDLIFLFLEGSSIISILNLVGITVDRLWCVMKPIQYRNSSRKYAVCICVSLWVLALLIISVVVHLYAIRGFYISLSVYVIIMPCLIFSTCALLCCCYLLIWQRLIKNRHTLESGNNQDTNEIAETLKRERQTALTLREKKLTKISTLIIVTFAICWLPLAGLYILARYNYINMEHIKLIMIFQLLATLNSVANPLLYLGAMKKRMERLCYGVRIQC